MTDLHMHRVVNNDFQDGATETDQWQKNHSCKEAKTGLRGLVIIFPNDYYLGIRIRKLKFQFTLVG